MAKQFAVFDIDGTILRKTLLQLIVKEFVNRGRIDAATAGDIERIMHDGRQRIADDTFGEYMQIAVEMLITGIGGTLSVAEYDEVIQAVAHTLTASTYVYTRQLIDTLKKNNFFLIAISGSEQRAVQAIAQTLGFNVCAAHLMYNIEGANITGNVTKFKATKAEVLQSIITDRGLSTRGSLAVGDTSKDISMFSLVEQPIAFNPNQELFKMARDKGWMVVLERKDVVYGLEAKDGGYYLKSVNV